MEEPGRLQSMESLRVGHDWATSLSCIGEGNGNPLQCSCLENPRDGGTWWTAVSGVTQSPTRLKRLSSSSSSRGQRNGNEFNVRWLKPSTHNFSLGGHSYFHLAGILVCGLSDGLRTWVWPMYLKLREKSSPSMWMELWKSSQITYRLLSARMQLLLTNEP